MISKQNMKIGDNFYAVNKVFGTEKPVYVKLIGIQQRTFIENLITNECKVNTKYLLTPVKFIDLTGDKHYTNQYVISEDDLETVFWSEEGAIKYIDTIKK